MVTFQNDVWGEMAKEVRANFGSNGVKKNPHARAGGIGFGGGGGGGGDRNSSSSLEEERSNNSSENRAFMRPVPPSGGGVLSVSVGQQQQQQQLQTSVNSSNLGRKQQPQPQQQQFTSLSRRKSNSSSPVQLIVNDPYGPMSGNFQYVPAQSTDLSVTLRGCEDDEDAARRLFNNHCAYHKTGNNNDLV